MIVSRTKRFLLIIAAFLAAGMLSVSSFGCGRDSPKTEPQADKQRLIESREELNQKRGELRDAVKSGASEDELEKRKNQVKEGREAIIQDKKDIRTERLGSTKDQNEAKQGTKSSKDAASKDTTSKDTK